MKPHPHQQEALRAIFAGLKQGHTQQLVVMPTGAGKTVLACHVLKRLGGRALFLVHTDELVRQTVKTLQQVLPASAIGVVKGEIDEGDKRIVVASVQTLRNPHRLRRLAKDFRTIAWDECHRAQANSYHRIRQYFAKATPFQLGLTATPWRLDGKPIEDLFPHTSVNLSIKDGVKDGWLSGVVGKLIYLKDADFSKLHLEHGDYKPSELEVVMRAANWDEYVAKAYFEHAGNRKTIIFVPTVAMAHQLAERIQAGGGLAEAVDGQMSVETRRDIIARLAAGKLNVVINCAVLTEGFDDPLISCVIMARPTASWRLYVQCVGRGLRPVKGKTCLVLDMVGATRRHSLVSFPLFAKREGLPNGGRPVERGESEGVGALSAEQEALWVDLLEEKEANPTCGRCGSSATRSQGSAGGGRTRYKCESCLKHFTATSNGNQSDRSLMRALPNPPCVRCKNGKVVKDGTYRNGNRKYKCLECGACFSLTLNGELTRASMLRLRERQACVHCKGETSLINSFPDGRQEVRCLRCGRSVRLASATGQRTQASLSRSQPNPWCTFCVNQKTHKAKLRKDGSYSYKCPNCKRGSTVRAQP